MARLALLLCWLFASAVVTAQKRVAPASGTFLVAKNEIESGPFHKSVVLLMVHNEKGTLGLIVNRTTDVPLAEALPELGSDTRHELYFGGPVAMSGLMYLFRAGDPDEAGEAERVMEDVYFSGDKELLEQLLKDKKRDELHLFVGHAGWAPGQLDAELVRGSWDVVPADAFSVFSKDPTTLWDELSKDSRVIARSSRPGRPSSRNAPAEAP